MKALIQVDDYRAVVPSPEAFRRGLELAAVCVWDEARRRGVDGRWAFEAVKRITAMARKRSVQRALER